MIKTKLPDSFRVLTQRALIRNVTRRMRVIAVAISSENITLRFYLDRPPIDDDLADAARLCNKLEDLLQANKSEYKTVRDECVYSDLPNGKIDTLDGSIYRRNEDEWTDADAW